MAVANPREVPEYELNPLELQVRKSDGITKVSPFLPFLLLFWLNWILDAHVVFELFVSDEDFARYFFFLLFAFSTFHFITQKFKNCNFVVLMFHIACFQSRDSCTRSKLWCVYEYTHTHIFVLSNWKGLLICMVMYIIAGNISSG